MQAVKLSKPDEIVVGCDKDGAVMTVPVPKKVGKDHNLFEVIESLLNGMDLGCFVVHLLFNTHTLVISCL